MIRFFSGNNPLNVVILFFIGLLIKLPYFITPVIPQTNVTDGFLYIEFLKALQTSGAAVPIIYPIISFVLLFTQAITFNGLVNDQKLFSSPNYLLALSYLVVTSVVPEWNVLSPALIINTILVWAWPRMVGLYNHPKPKTVLFNIGFGNPVLVKDFATEIAVALKKELHIEHGILPSNEVLSTHADTTKLQQFTGFKPSVSIEEGVKEMVLWFKQNAYE